MAAQQPARTSPELRARLHSARANVGITPRPGALPETGADYFTLTVRDYNFNANLGMVANQKDVSLQAIIPWGPKDAG